MGNSKKRLWMYIGFIFVFSQNAVAMSCLDILSRSNNGSYVTQGQKEAIRLRLQYDLHWRDFVEQRQLHLEIMNENLERSDVFDFNQEQGFKLLLEGKNEEYLLKREAMTKDRVERMSLLFSRQIEFFSFFNWNQDLNHWVNMFFVQHLSFAPRSSDPKWFPQIESALVQLIRNASQQETNDLNIFFARPENIKSYADLIHRLNAENNYLLNSDLLIPQVY